MDLDTTDPYEQKLYNMFKSFDTDMTDSLNKESLLKLCTSLELKDRGPKLVANLIKNERDDRVDFNAFKCELLNLLGSENDDEKNGATTAESSFAEEFNRIDKNSSESRSREVSPKLVVGGKKYGRRSRPHSAIAFDSQSDSEEESKSRSSKSSQRVQRSASQSDVHGSNNNSRIRTNNNSKSSTKLKRCASLPPQKQRPAIIAVTDRDKLNSQIESSESLGNLDFENLTNRLLEEWNKCEHATDDVNEDGSRRSRADLETIFERVGLQSTIANKLTNEIYSKLGIDTEQMITFFDFMALIQRDTELMRQSKMCDDGGNKSGCDELRGGEKMYVISPTSANLLPLDIHSNSDEAADLPSSMSFNAVVDLLEVAHVKNVSDLLDNLGFSSNEINLTKLSSTIDEELQDNHSEKELISLLRASLALNKTEVSTLQRSLRHSTYENKQLQANVHELNRRSLMLAQEVDERHAYLEKSARDELKQLEQRHAEIVRDLTSQLKNDREHWSQLNVKLENRIRQLEIDEAKHKSEVQRLRSENSALDGEQEMLQSQVADLLEMNIKLNNEIAEIAQSNDDAFRDSHETEEVLELMDKINQLQMENSELRDKNDEMVSELEEMHIELKKLRARKQTMRIEHSNSGGEDNASSSGEGSNVSAASATKRRGDSPSKAKLSEESPRLGKLRKYHNENSECESEISGDWMALNTELNQSTSMTATTSGISQDMHSLNDCRDEEMKELKAKMAKMQEELHELREKPSVDEDSSNTNVPESKSSSTLRQRIEELEASLEQMQREYEACEDYWQSKLNEERQLYEEEQRVSNEKFDELLRKMSEYEDQFASAQEKDGRLSPIDEKYQLEQQFTDLEKEMEEFREQARQIFADKQVEVERLQSRVRELEQKFDLESTLEQSTARSKISDNESVASSPINYLWHQGTIQAPTRDYQNPNWQQQMQNQSTANFISDENDERPQPIQPIQRPQTPSSATVTLSSTTLKNTAIENNTDNDNTEAIDDALSIKSFATHSVASTHSIHRSLPDALCVSPNVLREDIKRLKLIEIQLKEDIKGLAHHRDGLVMELQQLQQAKPVLEKSYARTPHPSLMKKIQQLEHKNLQLQQCLKQQQQFTETIMHQTWQQQRTEINEMRGTIETQGIIMNEQAQRLANSDLLVKDLYVENSQLAAAIQRLEQQRSRSNLLSQHQGVGSVPGML